VDLLPDLLTRRDADDIFDLPKVDDNHVPYRIGYVNTAS
jgi:hypothetical protein